MTMRLRIMVDDSDVVMVLTMITALIMMAVKVVMVVKSRTNVDSLQQVKTIARPEKVHSRVK